MAKSMTMYEVVVDMPGYPFDPCGFQSSSRTEARKELKRVNVRHPEAYLARVTYTRDSATKKGR
jgi:hypothetical protein